MSKFPVNRMLIGAVVPVLIYYFFREMNYPLAGAIGASVWSLCVLGWFLIKNRSLDGFSGIASVYSISELAGLAVTRNPDWYLLSPIVSDCVMGSFFLFSMLTSRPLIQILAEESTGKGDLEYSGELDECCRTLWLRLSLVWGAVYMVKGFVKYLFLSYAPVETYLIVRIGLGWPVVASLIMFSFWYPRHYLGMKTAAGNDG